ncbi:hypothetical protein Tco_0909218 [Tanacetum coccineum]|uniref:DUF4283 domain-containing protein n=1 Tax=Tanacetum coccineum TaxID=301880 RepID=A0ABQ5CPX3_9ASTR
MERGFLSQKGSRVGRGVKEKNIDRNQMDTTFGFGLSTESDDTMNKDTPVIVASAVKEGVTPSVVDMMAEKDKLSSLEDTTIPGSFPPLSTSVSTTAGNAPGKSSYANITSKPSGKKVNVHTLFTPGDENLLKEDVSTVPVWVNLHGVPVTAFSEDGLSAIATKLTDVELKDNIVMAMPKITREGHYTCNVRVEYEWKPPRCSSCKVFRHVHEECTMNTGVGEKKTVKKPSRTSRSVPVGPKIGFKPQKEYRPVTKKPTASSSGNKKKDVEPTIEVSNSNPFDVINLVNNDEEFGTNGGTNNLVKNEATSSGFSFMNIDNNEECASNTPIGAKIDKIERQIGEGKLRLLDNDGNPLVPTGIMESDSEVELVFLKTANLGILTSGKDGSDKGYGTNCLLEQWRDSYPDNDDYDPYDDDMYENHDFSEHLQSICDDLDIAVRGRKQK